MISQHTLNSNIINQETFNKSDIDSTKKRVATDNFRVKCAKLAKNFLIYGTIDANSQDLKKSIISNLINDPCYIVLEPEGEMFRDYITVYDTFFKIVFSNLLIVTPISDTGYMGYKDYQKIAVPLEYLIYSNTNRLQQSNKQVLGFLNEISNNEMFYERKDKSSKSHIISLEQCLQTNNPNPVQISSWSFSLNISPIKDIRFIQHDLGIPRQSQSDNEIYQILLNEKKNLEIKLNDLKLKRHSLIWSDLKTTDHLTTKISEPTGISNLSKVSHSIAICLIYIKLVNIYIKSLEISKVEIIKEIKIEDCKILSEKVGGTFFYDKVIVSDKSLFKNPLIAKSFDKE